MLHVFVCFLVYFPIVEHIILNMQTWSTILSQTKINEGIRLVSTQLNSCKYRILYCYAININKLFKMLGQGLNLVNNLTCRIPTLSSRLSI